MADLTTVAAVRALGSITSTTPGDAVLATLVTSVSDFIRTYTDRDFAASSYSEILSGSGKQELFLPHGPATAVSSLTVDAVAIPAQTADGIAGYFLARSGKVLALLGYTFTRGRNNVRVAYTAGSSAIPAQVAQACNEIVLAAYKRGPRGAETKNEAGVGNQTFGFSMDDVPAWAKLVLDNLKRVAPL